MFSGRARPASPQCSPRAQRPAMARCRRPILALIFGAVLAAFSANTTLDFVASRPQSALAAQQEDSDKVDSPLEFGATVLQHKGRRRGRKSFLSIFTNKAKELMKPEWEEKYGKWRHKR